MWKLKAVIWALLSLIIMRRIGEKTILSDNEREIMLENWNLPM